MVVFLLRKECCNAGGWCFISNELGCSERSSCEEDCCERSWELGIWPVAGKRCWSPFWGGVDGWRSVKIFHWTLLLADFHLPTCRLFPVMLKHLLCYKLEPFSLPIVHCWCNVIFKKNKIINCASTTNNTVKVNIQVQAAGRTKLQKTPSGSHSGTSLFPCLSITSLLLLTWCMQQSWISVSSDYEPATSWNPTWHMSTHTPESSPLLASCAQLSIMPSL